MSYDTCYKPSKSECRVSDPVGPGTLSLSQDASVVMAPRMSKMQEHTFIFVFSDLSGCVKQIVL